MIVIATYGRYIIAKISSDFSIKDNIIKSPFYLR